MTSATLLLLLSSLGTALDEVDGYLVDNDGTLSYGEVADLRSATRSVDLLADLYGPG